MSSSSARRSGCRRTNAASSRSPRPCTTSARSASRTRSCSSPAASPRTSGPRCKSTPSAAGASSRRAAAEIAAAHHERFDGQGYPSGLKGEAIPLGGRIVAVADVFDALTSERPYKKAWPLAEARAHLEANAGSHFDPAWPSCRAGKTSCGLPARPPRRPDRRSAVRGAAKASPSLGRRGDLELLEDHARLADRGEVGDAEPARILGLPGDRELAGLRDEARHRLADRLRLARV